MADTRTGDDNTAAVVDCWTEQEREGEPTEGSGENARAQKKDKSAAHDDALPHALLGQVFGSVVV